MPGDCIRDLVCANFHQKTSALPRTRRPQLKKKCNAETGGSHVHFLRARILMLLCLCGVTKEGSGSQDKMSVSSIANTNTHNTRLLILKHLFHHGHSTKQGNSKLQTLRREIG